MFFPFNGTEIAAGCGMQDIGEPGQQYRFVAEMEKMHLIDPNDGRGFPVEPVDARESG